VHGVSPGDDVIAAMATARVAQCLKTAALVAMKKPAATTNVGPQYHPRLTP